MNSAIKQFSRPGKKSSKRHNDDSGAPNSSSSSSLPIEVKKFAKQMGLNLHGLEAEAEDIWEMLNKMSMNNPIEYENFIAEQLKNGKLNENKDPTTTSTDPTDSKNNGRVIRPKSGFCIVCQTTGNDGLKIRENTSNYGKNFFINFCSHEAIDVPKDRNGRPVYDDRTSADGMEIPLVIGEKRDIDENTSIAIDILVHPVVIQRCQSHNIFQSQIIDLGLQWITQECPIQFNKKYQIINDREYVGGRGVDKSTPVLFNVDEVIAKQEGKDSSSSSSSSFSSQSIENNSKGSSLLNSIKQAKFGDGTRFDSDEEEDEPSLIIKSQSNRKNQTKSIPVIQEIVNSSPSEIEETKDDSTPLEKPSKSSKTKSSPLIKKGFLNSSKAQGVLYPEGSNEGTGGATGGSYARLMSKCQVVDTSTMQSIPPSNPIKEVSKAIQSEKSSQSILTATESSEIDDLMCSLDEEWNELSSKKKYKQPVEDELTKQLSQLASIIGGASPKIPSTTIPSSTTSTTDTISSPTSSNLSLSLYQLTHNLSEPLHPSVEIRSSIPGSRELVLLISGVEKSLLATCQLDVAKEDIRVQIGSKELLTLHCTFSCDITKVKAVMSKKKQSIEILIPELSS